MSETMTQDSLLPLQSIIIRKDGYLYAITENGTEIPVYIFHRQIGYQGVFNFLDWWDSESILVLQKYYPIYAHEGLIPPNLNSFFGGQKRFVTDQEKNPTLSSPRRRWDQLVFNGYPAYIFESDFSGRTAPESDSLGQLLFTHVNASIRNGPLKRQPIPPPEIRTRQWPNSGGP